MRGNPVLSKLQRRQLHRFASPIHSSQWWVTIDVRPYRPYMGPDKGKGLLIKMRILIYMLAMLTGFSAAEAARPVGGAAVTQGSSAVAAASVKAATILVAQVQRGSVNLHGFLRLSKQPRVNPLPIVSVAKTTPVSRADIALQ